MTCIVWLRRSLRSKDNTALLRAVENHEDVIPVYIIDKDLFKNSTLGYPRVRFWRDALVDVKEQFKEQGNDLIVRHGNPVDELKDLITETEADELHHNRDYTPYARERDEKIAEQLTIPITTHKDIVLFEQDEILTNKETPYKVYSYYRDKWFERDKPKPRSIPSFTTPSYESDPIPSVADLGFEKPEGLDWIWDASREGANKRLETFREKIVAYDQKRDYPADNATSKLSPHLKFGTISPREVFWEAERMRLRLEDEQGVQTWQEELSWREFYMQVLWHWPETTEKAFLEQYRDIDWHWDKHHQTLWQQFINGKTGYPFVDAAMRQLRQTGWMHNRPRMVVASFAAKDLHIDWQKLHTFFKKWFVDAEISAMVGGIQWAYSIGTDAQPYFRVFNPWTQGEKYDPEGDYIRTYVPELENVPDKYIHKPFKMPEEVQEESNCIIGQDYSEPVVDHDEERQKAVELFEAERNDS